MYRRGYSLLFQAQTREVGAYTISLFWGKEVATEQSIEKKKTLCYTLNTFFSYVCTTVYNVQKQFEIFLIFV